MATYFHGSSEIQADGLQTLYLMNPNLVGGYSDTNHQQQQLQPGNMLFLNSAAGNALNAATLSHAPPPQNHHFVGIPLSALGSANSEDPSRPSSMHEIPALHGVIPRFHYNLWGGGAAMDQTAAGNHHQHIPTPVAGTTSSGGGGGDDIVTQLGFRRPAVLSPAAQQGLSLSLSSQQPATAFRSLAGEVRDISGQAPVNMISPASGGEDVQGSGGSSSTVSNGISGIQSLILGSKYLKAAQQLLDEVVNVGKAIKSDTTVEGTNEEMTKMMNRESMAESDDNGNSNGTEASSKRGAELTTAQRQELQMKKAKLLGMLDEVEQRYRQYHHQMQIVASSFEQAAGIGSAKSYTAVALQTISKQFRCLKDAITAQVKAASKSLGEEEISGLGKGGEGSSRLKFVDHHLRQQRALQQLGMIHQHNAWRPQRGLPERAVSVLRAWLFEHFLHPYPKDSDKHMLAKQTGLTRSQVSNWFINARVRLWKPMVEEMYTEEMKDHRDHNGSEKNTNNKTEPNRDSSPGPKTTTTAPPQENTTATTFHQMNQTNNNHLKSKKDMGLMMMNQKAAASSPTHEFSNSTASTSPQLGGGFTLIGSSEMEGIVRRLSPKKARSSVATTSDYMQNSPSSILSMDMDMKPAGDIKFGIGNERRSYSSLIAEGGGGFGGYPIGEIGRFPAGGNSSSTVSLTLGLPHCDNLSLSGSAQQNYLSNHQAIQLGSRLEMGSVDAHFGGINNHPPPPPPSHSNAGFEGLNNIQNGKRFAAQLLPDFVA